MSGRIQTAFVLVSALFCCYSLQDCNYPICDDIETDCYDFDPSYGFHIFSHNRSVRLFVVLPKEMPDVLASLWSSDSDGLYCGNLLPEDTCQLQDEEIEITVTQVSVVQYYDFANVTAKYFCAKIASTSCCEERHTITLPFKDVGNATLLVPAAAGYGDSFTAAAGITSAVLLLLLGFVALLLRGKLLRSLLPNSPSPSESVKPFLPSMSSSPPLLLLYSRDDPAFLRRMAHFRDLLARVLDTEVMDPYDEKRFNELAKGWQVWLKNRLYRRDVKVVLVVSEGALVTQRARLAGVAKPPRLGARSHFLDGLFMVALNLLEYDAAIGDNYTRVYKVRFEDLMKGDEKLILVVPMKCFTLMRDMEHLLKDIMNCSTLPTSIQERLTSEQHDSSFPTKQNMSVTETV